MAKRRRRQLTFEVEVFSRATKTPFFEKTRAPASWSAAGRIQDKYRFSGLVQNVRRVKRRGHYKRLR